MAETLFTQLPVAVALTGAEVVPLDQPNSVPQSSFTTKRATTAQIASLGPGNAVNVVSITDASYAIRPIDRTALLSFINSAPQAATLPKSGLGVDVATPGWFAQIENRGTSALTITPFASETIDGAASLVLVKNQGVVIALGPDLNWYTQRGAGLTGETAVTSVGLSLPASIMSVSGSPVTTTGTLTGTLVTQAANYIWAGPVSGGVAAPAFRPMVTADLPNYGTAATYGNAATVAVVTTDAKGRVTATNVTILAQNANLAPMAEATLKGRASGAGTGTPSDLNATQLAPIIGAAFGVWFSSLPTDPSAVPSGGFWNNGGTLAQVP